MNVLLTQNRNSVDNGNASRGRPWDSVMVLLAWTRRLCVQRRRVVYQKQTLPLHWPFSSSRLLQILVHCLRLPLRHHLMFINILIHMLTRMLTTPTPKPTRILTSTHSQLKFTRILTRILMCKSILQLCLRLNLTTQLPTTRAVALSGKSRNTPLKMSKPGASVTDDLPRTIPRAVHCGNAHQTATWSTSPALSPAVGRPTLSLCTDSCAI